MGKLLPRQAANRTAASAESTQERQFRDWHVAQKEAPQKTLGTTIKGIS